MNSDENQLPKYLYKYADWSDQHHQRLLRIPAVYFSSARNFNDPFDSAVFPNYEGLTDEKILAEYRHHLKAENPSYSDEQVDQLAKSWFDEKWLRDPEKIQQSSEMVYKLTCDSFGMFCVSESHHSLLL